MKKEKIFFVVLLSVVAILLATRLFVVDVVRVPQDSKCPRAGKLSFVGRWSYGYRLPWKATSRISYSLGKRNDWVAYNQPVTSRDEQADTTAVRVGMLAAIPGDTIWYNNESGSISVKPDKKHGFSHPLIVPAKGQKIAINNDNMRFYAVLITLHEPVKATVVDGKLCVSGEMVKQYTFQHDYYWVENGDKKNPSDSRTYGFVPHASLIGRIL